MSIMFKVIDHVLFFKIIFDVAMSLMCIQIKNDNHWIKFYFT